MSLRQDSPVKKKRQKVKISTGGNAVNKEFIIHITDSSKYVLALLCSIYESFFVNLNHLDQTRRKCNTRLFRLPCLIHSPLFFTPNSGLDL